VSVRKTLAMLVQRTLMVFSATFAAEVLADLFAYFTSTDPFMNG
jgi:hypothetical protein